MNEDVFLVNECWLHPGALEAFKAYRKKTIEILLQHGAEFVYHGHPFAWASEPTDDDVPTGIEILRFDDEGKARAALTALHAPALAAEGEKVFRKIRSYLSAYAMTPSQRTRIAG